MLLLLPSCSGVFSQGGKSLSSVWDNIQGYEEVNVKEIVVFPGWKCQTFHKDTLKKLNSVLQISNKNISVVFIKTQAPLCFFGMYSFVISVLFRVFNIFSNLKRGHIFQHM